MKNNEALEIVSSTETTVNVVSPINTEMVLEFMEIIEYKTTEVTSNNSIKETNLVVYAGKEDMKKYYALVEYISDEYTSNDLTKRLNHFVVSNAYNMSYFSTLSVYTDLESAMHCYNKMPAIDIRLELFKQSTNWEKALYSVDNVLENESYMNDTIIDVLNSYSENDNVTLYNFFENVYGGLSLDDMMILTPSQIEGIILNELFEKESYKLKNYGDFIDENEAENEGYYWNDSLDKWIKLDF